MIDLAVSTDGGKMLMHEGFCVRDDTQYTRSDPSRMDLANIS